MLRITGVWHRGAVVHRPGDRKNGPGSGIGKSENHWNPQWRDRNDRTPPKKHLVLYLEYHRKITGKSLESAIFQTLSDAKRCEAKKGILGIDSYDPKPPEPLGFEVRASPTRHVGPSEPSSAVSFCVGKGELRLKVWPSWGKSGKLNKKLADPCDKTMYICYY